MFTTSLEKIKSAVVNKEWTYFKYTRVDKEYRFCPHYGEHKQLVLPGERATSAGFVHICGGEIAVPNIGSLGLGVDPLPEDPNNLAQLLNTSIFAEMEKL